MTGSPRLPRWLGTVVRVVLTVIAVAWISRSVRPGAALEELRAAPTWVFAIPAGLLMVNAVKERSCEDIGPLSGDQMS